MKTERIILVLLLVVMVLTITAITGFKSAKKMSNTAAYHSAVQHRLENILIDINKSYNDSITAIKYQEYNRLCK